MDYQVDKLNTKTEVFFAAAERRLPRHKKDLQNVILIDAVGAQQQFVAEPRRLSLFDRFKGALAALDGAPAMTG